MRGARTPLVSCLGLVGIIPAYAGSTMAVVNERLRGKDHPRVCGEHPRVCGEHPRDIGVRHIVLGSSPRMRGALGHIDEVRPRKGIIPAYAGSTDSNSWRRSRGQDHPRVCGEHQAALRVARRFEGSSPRMRGAHDMINHGAQVKGIIPAYAGSTFEECCMSHARRDHPRVCGEHERCHAGSVRRLGSSPRMRGALHELVVDIVFVGIIPAYAGSTTVDSDGVLVFQDHPRVCGEHVLYAGSIIRATGSSPRMRGALSSISSISIPWRIIPAYAGSTRRIAPNMEWPEDHPRVCGEHIVSETSYFLSKGSSPRMRGAPDGG